MVSHHQPPQKASCIHCGQEAKWQAYRAGEELLHYVCSKCKPDPWTAGDFYRKGVYYRPIKKE